MPLPDYWRIVNPKDSSEEFTQIMVVKSDVSPHISAIQVMGNPVAKNLAVIWETRYHRTYDGSLHFSVKLPNEKTKFSAMIR